MIHFILSQAVGSNFILFRDYSLNGCSYLIAPAMFLKVFAYTLCDKKILGVLFGNI